MFKDYIIHIAEAIIAVLAILFVIAFDTALIGVMVVATVYYMMESVLYGFLSMVVLAGTIYVSGRRIKKGVKVLVDAYKASKEMTL